MKPVLTTTLPQQRMASLFAQPFLRALIGPSIVVNECKQSRIAEVKPGARVVNHKGSIAALVTYDTPKNEKMSLLIASGDSAVVAGGDEIRFGSLTFHYRNDGTLKVITWSNHGLSYALVSTIAGSSREPSLVCHQSMADRDAFKSGQ